MALVRLLYFSENQIDTAKGSMVKQLSSILSASNRNNKPKGLTGALVFDDLWFLQALEGERETVWRTFEMIRRDERHANIELVEMLGIEARTFGNWWMGLAVRNETTMAAFAPHLDNGRLDPRRMTAADILSLMVSLAEIGLSRTVVRSEAA